ncbi:hypothetical protein AB0G74_16310 [Streptomyces sp. NPDC020875]|uniref:hypothetical protein n=1 Tax=Streptomyces sp. NPDC020875 TaxID=3154898 RepID=UPI0033FD0983
MAEYRVDRLDLMRAKPVIRHPMALSEYRTACVSSRIIRTELIGGGGSEEAIHH